MVREIFIQAAYLVASILFIFGLRSLTRADEARLAAGRYFIVHNFYL